MVWFVLIGVVLLLGFWYMMYRSGNPSFWKLASRFPDQAFDWFMSEDCWVVFDPSDPAHPVPHPRGDYSGPFFLWIPKLGGKRVTIYGKHDRIEASQERFEQWMAQELGRGTSRYSRRARSATDNILAGGKPPFRGRAVGLPPAGLAAISTELGRQLTPDQIVQNLFDGTGRQEIALDALLDYCEEDESIRQVMSELGASRDTLKKVYSNLMAAGAGKWAGGHYVAASAMAYPHTLRYVLSRPDSGLDELLETACRLMMYFERGASLE